MCRLVMGNQPPFSAPNLFRNARFKARTIARKLHNSKWIKNIGPINSPSLLNKYVMLYTMLSSITPTTERDQIF
jgi:hypothetical protein